MKKTLKTNRSQTLVAPNVSRISMGNYRCRVSINGTRYENYETSIKRAKTWVKDMRNGNIVLPKN